MNSQACVRLIFLGAVLLLSCKGEKREARGVEDLEHAIEMLEQRRTREMRIIDEQGAMRTQMIANQKAANSQGMRDKIAADLNVVEASVAKAQKNLANQDSILIQLKFKRDSLESLFQSAQ